MHEIKTNTSQYLHDEVTNKIWSKFLAPGRQSWEKIEIVLTSLRLAAAKTMRNVFWSQCCQPQLSSDSISGRTWLTNTAFLICDNTHPPVHQAVSTGVTEHSRYKPGA